MMAGGFFDRLTQATENLETHLLDVKSKLLV